MAKYTEAQARASKKYLAQFAEIRIRLTPEEKEKVTRYAESVNKSVNQFCKDAITINPKEIPGEAIASAAAWLRSKGHTDEEIKDFLSCLGQEKDG